MIGTQSAGPEGGAGSGQTPAELSWYGVWQPLMIALLNSAAPGPSQAMALVWLPPVSRSMVVWAAFVRSRLPSRPTRAVIVCVPADSVYGAPSVVVAVESARSFTGPDPSSLPL